MEHELHAFTQKKLRVSLQEPKVWLQYLLKLRYSRSYMYSRTRDRTVVAMDLTGKWEILLGSIHGNQELQSTTEIMLYLGGQAKATTPSKRFIAFTLHPSQFSNTVLERKFFEITFFIGTQRDFCFQRSDEYTARVAQFEWRSSTSESCLKFWNECGRHPRPLSARTEIARDM